MLLIPNLADRRVLPCGCKFETFAYSGMKDFYCQVVSPCGGKLPPLTFWTIGNDRYDDIDDAVRNWERQAPKPVDRKGLRVIEGGKE